MRTYEVTPTETSFTGVAPTDVTPTYQVMLRDGAVEVVDGADAYQQEGPMTTFFRRGDGRDVIDSWSTRIASFRTADLTVVRRHEAAAAPATTAPLRLAS